ncbi:MAG: phosphatase PAP2 family protein [Acidobacteriia bacterium]|nr:phosphatase PAP2 family protein [Terriglobia bacterium]
MKAFAVCLFVSSFALPAFCQMSSDDQASQPPQAQEQGEAQRAAPAVQPGPPAIKNKDLWAQTGYFHPFVRMPRYVLHDQKQIWTSPFHTSKADAKWWAVFGAGTAALIATDKWTQKHAPNNSTLVNLGTNGSYLGAAYTLIPISAGFYFLGTKAGSQHFRETGLLCFETLIDSTLVEEALKLATDRERPLEGDGSGHFWAGSATSRWNSSFPSGHSINTFALASVFAHEYHQWWVRVIAYAYAGGVAMSRLAANKHFPGDTLAGGAMGWFIGDYVYHKRHNPEIKANLGQKILSHVRIGGPPPMVP